MPINPVSEPCIAYPTTKCHSSKGKTMTGMTLMPIPKIPKDIECNNPTLTRCLFQPSFQHCVNSLDLNLAQDMQHLTMPGSPCLSTGRMGMIGAGGPMTRRMPTIIKTIQGDHLPCPIYFSSITYNLINIYLYIYMYIYHASYLVYAKPSMSSDCEFVACCIELASSVRLIWCWEPRPWPSISGMSRMSLGPTLSNSVTIVQVLKNGSWSNYGWPCRIPWECLPFIFLCLCKKLSSPGWFCGICGIFYECYCGIFGGPCSGSQGPNIKVIPFGYMELPSVCFSSEMGQ